MGKAIATLATMNSGLTLRILQYNVRKTKNIVMAPLFKDPGILGYDVIAIQEPWMNPFEYNSHNPLAHTFTLWLPKPGVKPPGVAIYVNKRLDHAHISFTSHSSNVISLALSHGDNTLYIHNVYNQPEDAAQTSIIKELMAVTKAISSKPHPHDQLIIGDFNMEGPEWATEDLGDRGSARQGLPLFREFLEAEGLELILPPGTITRTENQAESTIDLTIGTRGCLAKLLECRRADEIHHDSDHWPIQTILQLEATLAKSRTPTKLWKRTPVDEFVKTLGGRLPRIQGRLTDDDVTKHLLEITQALVATIDEVVPTTSATNTRHTPGFTPECKAKCTEVQKLRRIWQKTRDEKTWEAYKEARNQKGKFVAKALSEAFQEKIDKAARDGPKGLWDLAKWARSKGAGVASQRVTPTIEDQDTYEGKVAALSKVFFPKPPPIDETNIPYSQTLGVHPPLDHIPSSHTHQRDTPKLDCPPLTKDEIKQAIFRPQPHKAPGPSGIPNYILRISVDLLLPLLQPLFNHCLFRGISPFKESITVVLKKPDKDDYNKAKAYRPIALLDTLGKALESALAERISYYVETYKLLPEDHIGARKTRSTEHAIHTLLERIYKAHARADQGSHMVATLLMLDASGAFDNVHHDKLIECLIRRGLPTPITSWIKAWLQGRRTKLRLPEGESSWIELKYGVPQGSSLSPILWLFYNADLLDEITIGAQPVDLESQGLPSIPGLEISTTAWVDDTGILLIGNSASENCRALERIHIRAADWASRYGCVFAPEKYEIIHFHTDKSLATTIPAPLEDWLQLPGIRPKEPTRKLRHLGVWFDPALTWESHLQEVATKVRKSIQAIKIIASSDGGFDTLQLRQLYQAIIVPQATYCSSVWYQPYDPKAFKITATKRQLGILRELQREALVTVTGGIKTTAGAAMAMEMHVLPIEQQLLQLNHMAYLRLKANPLTKGYGVATSDTKRKSQWRSPLTRLTIEHQHHYRLQPTLEEIRPYVVPPWWRPVSIAIAKDTEAGQTHHDRTLRGHGNKTLVFYTDGSGFKGGVGASAYQPIQKTSGVARRQTAYLGPLTQSTVYLAELKGIQMALKIAMTTRQGRGQAFSRVDIFTDNQAAITSSSWPLRQSGQFLLRQIAGQVVALRNRQIQVHIHWIPAHTGVEGNEEADRLAKQAAGKGKSGGTGQSPLFTTVASQRMLAKRMANVRWEAEWDASNSGRALFNYQKIPTKGTLQKYRALKRAVAATIFQMRAGKIGLNDYLWTIQKSDSPICQKCGGDDRQTVRHVLLTCTAFQTLRQQVWLHPKSGWTSDSQKTPTSIREMWEDPKLAKTAAIFMLRTGLLGQFTRAVEKGVATQDLDEGDA